MRISRRQFLGSGAAATLLGYAPLGCREASSKLTFAEINDLHLDDIRTTSIVTKAVNMINADKSVSFTVVCGDLSDDGQIAQLGLAKESLARLQQGYHAVPGNHDYLKQNPNTYEEVFTELNWSFDIMGWRFMGIDSRDSRDRGTTEASISAGQIGWITESLSLTHPEKPIALFAHHPFNPNTSYRVENAKEVLDLFKAHNLRIVAAGHFHGNQVEKEGNILFTTTACCSVVANNEGQDPASRGYRLFHIDKATVATEYVEVARIPG